MGAFAIDLKTGLGASKGMRSKRSAQSAAMSACRDKGGTNCKIQIAFFNQCAVIVQGKVGFSVSSRESFGEATEAGIKICKEGGNSGCYVYFSECSAAELVR